MERRPLLIGNWKMHKTAAEARSFAAALAVSAARLAGTADYVVCAPFTALHVLCVTLPRAVALGAQNVHPAAQGAFTGEISTAMLREWGVQYVLVGHSERRRLFAESDAWVGEKAAAVLAAGMRPVVCLGEDEAERAAGATEAVVGRQLQAALAAVSADQAADLVLAYEPVWAIGSGRTPLPEEAQAVASWLRAQLAERWGAAAAAAVRILYGGSVNADNLGSFAAQPDLDGALVGGASLDPASFLQMAYIVTGGNA
ncbi:MAG: triose-phosphate isomerase, partial [Alicyclobacillus sp.]|nr:triose-phosphate isomerase [Alicyclobacillus sp.]